MRRTAQERANDRIRRAEYSLRRKSQEHSRAITEAAEEALDGVMATDRPAAGRTTETLAALEAAALRYAELVPGKKRRRRRKS